jgi:hypothetical protein
MDEATQARPAVYPKPNRHAQETPLCHVPLSAANAARSARNIATWNAYLPTACVRTMIRMGWDYTT